MKERIHGKSRTNLQTEFACGYVYADLQKIIKSVVATSGGAITESALTIRLGHVLLSTSVREELGYTEYLPEVWGETAQNNAVSPETDVHVRTRSKRTLASKKKRRNWMTGKSKAWISKEMSRRYEVSRAKREAA